MKNTIYLLMILFILGCASTPEINKVEKLLGQSIKCNYKIENYRSDYNSRSVITQFDLEFSEGDFNQLLSTLDLKSFKRAGQNYYKNVENDSNSERLVIFVNRKTIRYSAKI